MTKKTGIVILAVEEYTGRDRPKYAVASDKKSLVKRLTVEPSVHSGHCVIVVLNPLQKTLQAKLAGNSTETIINTNWKNGISSSIKMGLQSLLNATPDLEQCIICASDRHFININLFNELKSLADKTGKGIIATKIAEIWDLPVLFSKRFFDELLSDDGHQRINDIIAKQPDDIAILPLGETESEHNLRHQHAPRTMVSVDTAKEIIDSLLPKPQKARGVRIQDALGSTLASDVYAQFSIPNFEQSSMDGYAIHYEDRELELQVVGTIPAGMTMQKTLSRGNAMRIFTGAPLPIGADTVVMQEKVQVTKNRSVWVKDQNLRQGDNIRARGSEVKKGALALQDGTFLTPAAIGYLAGIGCTHVDTYSTPRVAIILTGDELIPPGEQLGFGEVYESNSYQLSAALTQLGINDVEVLHIPDNLEHLETAIERSLARVDMLLLVGGVSVGDYDFVATATKKCGIEQQFHKIRQKPGKPLFFGNKGEKLVIGLPGNPSSTLTCFYLYAAPALEKLMRVPPRIKKIIAPIRGNYHKKEGLTHFLKGSYNGEELIQLHAQDSYRLQSYAQANCLIIIPEQAVTVLSGTNVEAYLL